MHLHIVKTHVVYNGKKKEYSHKMAVPTAKNDVAFEKCGEITTAVQIGKRIFALNCIYCAAICLQLEKFSLHMKEEHSELLYQNIHSTDDEETIEDEPSDDDELDLAQKEYYLDETTTFETQADVPGEAQKPKRKNEESENFQDPLEEFVLQNEKFLSEISAEDDNDIAKNIKATVLADTTENRSNCTDEETSDDEYMNNDHDDVDNTSECSELESNAVPDEWMNTNNKQLTLAIIDGYQKHHILWDVNEESFKSRKKREEAFRKIAASINKEMHLNITPKTVGDYIKKLRYKFRSELQNHNLAQAKGEIYTPLWYFDKLAFLNATIKYKQRNKRGAKALANEKPALPLSNLSDAQNLTLIDIYQSFGCLWNVQHIGFRFKNQRQEALDEMLHAIKTKMDLTLTRDELQKKLYRIRYACTQEKHRKMQCKQRCESFQPTCKYYAEISFLENNVGPFKCEYCEQTFNGVDQYKIHKSKHDGSMPFTCPLCQRGFMKAGNCTVHLRRHTRDYPFECKECGKRFATSTDVNVHMRYHTGEKPYFCEICGQSFRTWTFFDAHMRRHQQRPKRHQCTICSKAFHENNKLTEHMKAHLNVRDKVCLVCGKAFTSSKYLRQHKQIHAEKKKYVCKICNKNFAQYAGLSGHMKSHGTTVTGAAIMEKSQ